MTHAALCARLPFPLCIVSKVVFLEVSLHGECKCCQADFVQPTADRLKCQAFTISSHRTAPALSNLVVFMQHCIA